MFRTVSVALAATAMVASASAQSSLANDTRMVRDVSLNDLVALVESMGHTVEARQNVGDVSVRGVTDTGLKYLLIGTVCSEGADSRCKGINMQVRYTYEEPQNYEYINEANLGRAAVSVWRSGNTLGITRYIILDGGQTMENLKVNVRNLVAIAPAAFDFAKNGNPN